VERWKDSGLTAKEFAAETGINANTLSNWGWKLAVQRRSSPQANAVPTRSEATFVDVTPSSAVGMTPQAALRSGAEVVSLEPEPLEIVLRDGRLIRVPLHFDDGALRRVVLALEGC